MSTKNVRLVLLFCSDTTQVESSTDEVQLPRNSCLQDLYVSWDITRHGISWTQWSTANISY